MKSGIGKLLKKRSLVVSFIFRLGILFIGLNILQIVLIGSRARKTVNSIYSEDIEQLTSSYAVSIGNRMEGYLNNLNFYTESDIAQTEDTEAISKWLSEHKGNRSPDFDYVVYGSPDYYWHQENGTSGKTNGVYFMSIMKDGKTECIDNPKLSNSTKTINIHVAKAVRKNGRNTGLFSGTMGIEWLRNYISSIKVGETGFAWLMDYEGTVVIHKDKDLEMNKNYLTSTEPEDKEMAEFAKTVVKRGSGSGWVNTPDGRMFMAYAPIEHTFWSFVYTISEKDINRMSDQLSKMLVTSTVIIILLVLIFSFVIIRSILKPVKNLKKAITDIASGSADLTKRLSVYRNDEIGSVVLGFNQFTEKLHGILSSLNNTKLSLLQNGKEMYSTSENTSSSISQIISNIGVMQDAISSQSANVSTTASAVNEISSNVDSLNRMIESQAASVTKASTSIEQMIGTISDVNKSVNNMAGAFKTLEENATRGMSMQADMNHKIEDIKSQSQTLQEANLVISSIAAQTNLLAMNAAIEAAHAGEAGKGFSVVADEIRKLSENSSTQSKSIGNQLKLILDSISGIVSASEDAMAAFSAVAENIKSTNLIVEQITTATESQENDTREIHQALTDMNNSTAEVKSASSEMSTGNKIILEEITQLQLATDKMKDASNSMVAQSQEISSSGSELISLAKNLDKDIEEMGNQIDLFKL